MATKRRNNRRTFRQLEQQITKVIAVDAALFVLALIVSGLGITWLKVILAVATIALSALGCLFLVLIDEHKRRRSLWMLVAFGAILLCMVVSLLARYPAPAITAA